MQRNIKTKIQIKLTLFVCSLQKRHKADDETNRRQVEVLRDGNWLWLAWQEIGVGDVVRVRATSFFPADLLLVSSSEPHSLCYIETANLDGETNLKIRQALPATANLLSATALTTCLVGQLHCDLPNRHLYEFNGTLKLPTTNEPQHEAASLSLGPDQVLQRGARLQNTKWASGIVLYTGHETKLLQNSATAAPLKVLHYFIPSPPPSALVVLLLLTNPFDFSLFSSSSSSYSSSSYI